MPPQARKPPRRKAKQERSRASVDLVLDAAARVLVQEGYARATTNRIAGRAGLSVGTLYQYFEDKDQIFDALIRRTVERVLAALASLEPDPEQPLEEALRTLLSVGVSAQPLGPELYRYLEYVPNALFRRHLAEVTEQLVARVRSLLELHRSRLRVSDIDVAAHVVVHSVVGLGYGAPPELWGERLVDEATELLVRYLVDSPSPPASSSSAAGSGSRASASPWGRASTLLRRRSM